MKTRFQDGHPAYLRLYILLREEILRGDRQYGDITLTRGTEVYVRKVAPLGDPVEVTVRNYELSIRKADAEMIEVE